MLINTVDAIWVLVHAAIAEQADAPEKRSGYQLLQVF
jgi:hypothetical protein